MSDSAYVIYALFRLSQLADASEESYASHDITIEPQTSTPIPRMKDRRGRSAQGKRAMEGYRAVNQKSTETNVVQQPQPDNGYETPDVGNDLPLFAPERPPGLHLEGPRLRGSMTTALDFFRLFFSDAIMHQICINTNVYAWRNIQHKSSYGDKDGAWVETAPQELSKLIALIIYFGLYHGLWARSMMSQRRFKALMGMLHVVDPTTEDPKDKLRKVSSFLDHFKRKFKEFYQPFQSVSVDKRMVKSKHRSSIRQYIKNKPTKWGIKLWGLADSTNGYTVDFDVYIGRKAGNEPSQNGLGYQTVMNLMDKYTKQGYHVYFDHFYTSVKLVKDLLSFGVPATGTASDNRKGFPDSMKKGTLWARKKERGNMKWERDGVFLAQQWKDNRVVTILSSIEHANDFVMTERKEKIDGIWQRVEIKQPKAIDSYNNRMNGVDRSDQLIVSKNVLRKCLRWRKTLFFHMIDTSIVNSYILFQLHRVMHQGEELLQRTKKFSVTEVKEELVRELVGLGQYGNPPIHGPPKERPGHVRDLSHTKIQQIKMELQSMLCHIKERTQSAFLL